MGESDVIKDIDWFLELPNELEIMTNERRFSDAVVLIQKCTSTHSHRNNKK
jgi:hypothetical protein